MSSIKSSQNVKRLCVTINNYKEQDKKFFEWDQISFYVFQFEKAETTGTPHIQGYIEFKTQSKFSVVCNYVTKMAYSPMHFSIAKGSAESNIKYCTKEETRVEGPFMKGEPVSKSAQKSIGILDFQMCLEKAKQGTSINQLFKEDPEYTIKNIDKLKHVINLAQEEQGDSWMKSTYGKDQVNLKPWQQRALDRLFNQTDRQILWCWDNTGNSGKSFLAKYLYVNHKAQMIRSGNLKDIALMYNTSPIVAFDLSRSTFNPIKRRKVEYQNGIFSGNAPKSSTEDEFEGQRFSMAAIEAMKDGVLTSSKYHSKTKLFKPPQIVIFANTEPDRSQMSEDRWDLMDIKAEMDSDNQVKSEAESDDIPLQVNRRLVEKDPHQMTKDIEKEFEELRKLQEENQSIDDTKHLKQNSPPSYSKSDMLAIAKKTRNRNHKRKLKRKKDI